MDSVVIRKFPYPYQAMVAIANDIDNTPSLQIFLEMMKLLNTDKETIFGKGLGLEVGSSFWFYNNTDTNQLSYYKGISNIETDFAGYCRELWHSTHIDINHAYGNFDAGGFHRKIAEKSLEILDKNNVEITTWINHGNQNNLQNIGLFDHQMGACPDNQNYHFDLLKEQGLRYIWQGKMTHVLGQSAKNRLNVRIKNNIQKILANTKYKSLSPKPFILDNQLMSINKLQDNNKIWDFQRFANNWGRYKIFHIHDLVHQTKPGNIKQLIANNGCMIIYTHMCEGLTSPTQFPEKLWKNLRFIKDNEIEKKLIVTTTSRLLKYFEISQHLDWQTIKRDNYEEIQINPELNTLSMNYHIKEADLQGITFYINEKKNVKITLNNRPIKCHINDKDSSGKYSVSIPWTKLEYPF